MVHYKQAIDGIARYIDSEIVPKMDGLQKWIFGTGAGIAMRKADEIFHQLKDHQLLKALDLVKGEDINIELIYEELIKQANQSAVKIEIPLLGTLSLNKDDIEKMYRIIMYDYLITKRHIPLFYFKYLCYNTTKEAKLWKVLWNLF